MTSRVAWELVDLTTGQVRRGQRELGPTDFEVMVTPPPARPQLGLLRTRPQQVVADAASWLLTGGRGLTTKRFRLADGFEMVLRERPTPARPSLVHLTAQRTQPRLTCHQAFRVDPGGATANQVNEAGSVALRWDQNKQGFPELVGTAVITDVTFHLRVAGAAAGREPVWLVRILAGSAIEWPRSADGLRLVPRLRPDTRPPRTDEAAPGGGG